MKTTLEIPDDLFREAKAKAALEGIRLRDLVTRGLEREVRGAPHPGHADAPNAVPARGHPEPLVRSSDELPFVPREPGSPVLQVSPERIHELEMAAELERHAPSVRQ